MTDQERENMTQMLINAVKILRDVDQMQDKLTEARKEAYRCINQAANALGMPGLSPSSLNPKRRRGEAKEDLRKCVAYLFRCGKPVHINLLLSEALGQEVTLRNRNRLSAAIFADIKREDGFFKKFEKGRFGLRQFDEPQLQAGEVGVKVVLNEGTPEEREESEFSEVWGELAAG